MTEAAPVTTQSPQSPSTSQPETPDIAPNASSVGQHSPSKTASAWWRASKSGGSNTNDEPTGLFVRRPGSNRSAVSSHAVPGVVSSVDVAPPDPNAKTPDGVPSKYADSPIFGAPLDVSSKYAGVRISLTDNEGENFVYGQVPAIIAKCAVYLKQNARQTEGIFRIPGSVRRIRMLQDSFSTPPSFGKNLDWTGFTVHDAANLLKRYFACLPEPVIPREKYEAFRSPMQKQFAHLKHTGDPKSPQVKEAADSSENAKEDPIDESNQHDKDKAIASYEDSISSLPTSSGKSLLYLIDSLSVFAAESEVNRMPAYNLAAIFQPSVSTIPEHDMVPEESEISREVLQFLIENSGASLERVQNHAIKQHEELKHMPELQHQQSSSNNSFNMSPYISANDRSSHETVNSSADEDTKPTVNVPQSFVSGTSTAHSSTHSSTPSFQTHTRRHSKSLSSAQQPSLSLQDNTSQDIFPDQALRHHQPKELPQESSKFPGFLRRQRSTRSYRSGSGSRSPSEEAEAAPDDTERKSRFRRSLMILLPSRNASRSPSPVR